ncbi:MAG: hypothetical protein ACRDD1_08200, partial [Planctomycetia bacterium]
AGSMSDGDGPTSSSRLLFLKVDGPKLTTRSQMAFWLRPGETSAGLPARNTTVLSDHVIEKTVILGLPDLPHAVGYDVTFHLPATEKHTVAQFETVTGYMPAVFEKFHALDLMTGSYTPLDDGPGEQSWPVVFSTDDGSHAMGVYSPDQPSSGFETEGYGRFRFVAEKVVKWNCVHRVRNAAGVPPGVYAFRNFLAVGTLEDVRKTLVELHRRQSKNR